MNAHRRDVFDWRADARELDLANRIMPCELPGGPVPTARCGRSDQHGAHADRIGFCAGNVNIVVAVTEADIWYAQRPVAFGGGRPDALTGTDGQ